MCMNWKGSSCCAVFSPWFSLLNKTELDLPKEGKEILNEFSVRLPFIIFNIIMVLVAFKH